MPDPTKRKIQMMKPVGNAVSDVFSVASKGKFIRIKATPWSKVESGVYFVADVKTRRGRFTGGTTLELRKADGTIFALDWKAASGEGKHSAQAFSVEHITDFATIQSYIQG
jgi:hypothetical protein